MREEGVELYIKPKEKITLVKNGNGKVTERQHEHHFRSKAASKLKVKKFDFEQIFPKPFTSIQDI